MFEKMWTSERVTREQLRREFHQFAVEDPGNYDHLSFEEYLRRAIEEGDIREVKEYRVGFYTCVPITVEATSEEEAYSFAVDKLGKVADVTEIERRHAFVEEKGSEL